MTRIMIALLGSLAVVACNTDTNPAATPEGGSPAETGEPAVPPPPGETVATAQTPQQFVEAVAASDKYEIEAARLAQSNGKSQATKDFAAMMIKDHTASTKKLMDAARKSQPPIMVEPALMPEQQADLDALKEAGDRFDQTYAQQQTTAHQKALGMLKAYAANGDDAALKSFASEVTPIVQGHADHAGALPGK